MSFRAGDAGVAHASCCTIEPFRLAATDHTIMTWSS
jgi:hypothetical protein